MIHPSLPLLAYASTKDKLNLYYRIAFFPQRIVLNSYNRSDMPAFYLALHLASRTMEILILKIWFTTVKTHEISSRNIFDALVTFIASTFHLTEK